MIGMSVGQDDRADVGHAPADRRESRFELPVIARVAGVDDRQLAAVVDDVPVDPAASEPVDGIRDAFDIESLRPGNLGDTRT